MRPKGSNSTTNQLELSTDGILTINGALKAPSAVLNGALTANSATLSGTFNAPSVTVSDTLTAPSGTITTLTATNATINEDLTVTDDIKCNTIQADASLITDNILGSIICGTINGYYFGSWDCLWSGAYYMNDAQSIDLSETPISDYPHGIVLIFSRYDSSSKTAQDSGINCFFVPKAAVKSDWYSDCSFAFNMFTSQFDIACCKKLYISDTLIKGHADNSATGTGTSGIKYTNTGYVLREVLGV